MKWAQQQQQQQQQQRWGREGATTNATYFIQQNEIKRKGAGEGDICIDNYSFSIFFAPYLKHIHLHFFSRGERWLIRRHERIAYHENSARSHKKTYTLKYTYASFQYLVTTSMREFFSSPSSSSSFSSSTSICIHITWVDNRRWAVKTVGVLGVRAAAVLPRPCRNFPRPCAPPRGA